MEVPGEFGSPNSHTLVSGPPVEVLVKFTVSGAHPSASNAVKSATGNCPKMSLLNIKKKIRTVIDLALINFIRKGF